MCRGPLCYLVKTVDILFRIIFSKIKLNTKESKYVKYSYKNTKTIKKV